MKRIIFFFVFFISVLLFPQHALAACHDSTECPPGYTCDKTNTLSGICTTAPANEWRGCPAVITALGPIPTAPECLVKWVLTYAILMGGGIAFLLSLWGAITIILASGNPEKINEGKEIITSAITGLLFIILSIFLLRLIGVDILQLPGFAK